MFCVDREVGDNYFNNNKLIKFSFFILNRGKNKKETNNEEELKLNGNED